MPSNEEVVNEYLLDAYEFKKNQVRVLQTQLQTITEKYETTLNTYADVCRRADKMQKAGDEMRDWLLAYPEPDSIVEALIDDWGEANV
jgi:hypothetical protein